MQGSSFGNDSQLSSGRASSPLNYPNIHINNSTGVYHHHAPQDHQHHHQQEESDSPYRTKAMASTTAGTTSAAAGGGPTAGLNETLNTEALDISEDDTSIQATLTRAIASYVGKCCTPRQMLVVLRLLKAVTFCFLILTIAADIMYLFFVSFLATREVNEQLGGFRDSILRLYGLIMGIMALMIELDMAPYVRYFSGLKGFIPRSLLLFFISTVTNSHPLNVRSNAGSSSSGGGDDDDSAAIGNHIPYSSIAFQIVTSFVLAICALTYFVLGILCFDRFTSRAFLSDRDPVLSTALPSQQRPQNDGSYDGV